MPVSLDTGRTRQSIAWGLGARELVIADVGSAGPKHDKQQLVHE